jgi:hypothetical protein
MGVLATIPRASANYHFHLGTGEIRTAQANPRQKKKGQTQEEQGKASNIVLFSCFILHFHRVPGYQLGEYLERNWDI